MDTRLTPSRPRKTSTATPGHPGSGVEALGVDSTKRGFSLLILITGIESLNAGCAVYRRPWGTDSLGRYAVGTIHPLFYNCLFVHQVILLGFIHPLDFETPTARYWPREWCRMCRLTRCLTLKSGSRVARDVGRPSFPSVIQPTPNPPDRREETVFQGCSSQSITPATSTLRPYVLIFTQTAVSDSFSWNIMTFNHAA